MTVLTQRTGSRITLLRNCGLLRVRGAEGISVEVIVESQLRSKLPALRHSVKRGMALECPHVGREEPKPIAQRP